MAAARLHIFYGADSYASQQAVQGWVAKYTQKYDAATITRVGADEGAVSAICAQVAEATDSLSLFSGTRLVIISRATGHAQAVSLLKALTTQLIQSGALGDPLLTIVWREEQGLSDKHPLFVQLKEEITAGRVQLHESLAPSSAQLGPRITALAQAQGVTVATDGVRWITRQYQVLEQLQRSQQRLKKDQPLLEDYRSWWLVQLIAQAALLSSGAISTGHLEAVAPVTAVPPSYFAIADAVVAGDIQSALRLWQGVCSDHKVDEETVRGLVVVLRWAVNQPKRTTGVRKAWLLRMLGEIELLERNFDTQSEYYVELLLLAMADRVSQDIMPLRSLWIAHWARS